MNELITEVVDYIKSVHPSFTDEDAMAHINTYNNVGMITLMYDAMRWSEAHRDQQPTRSTHG